MRKNILILKFCIVVLLFFPNTLKKDQPLGLYKFPRLTIFPSNHFFPQGYVTVNYCKTN